MSSSEKNVENRVGECRGLFKGIRADRSRKRKGDRLLSPGGFVAPESSLSHFQSRDELIAFCDEISGSDLSAERDLWEVLSAISKS